MSTGFTSVCTFEVIVCCWEGYGIAFGIPKFFEEKRRSDHFDFYCPNGHRQSYSAESTEERLKKQLASAQQRCTDLDSRLTFKQQRIEHLDRALSTTRGHVTRLKKRAAAGKCPCCSETFANLAAHMKKAHAGYGKE